MFVVDLLHEFELGVWKATFIHIIRLLFAAVPGGGAVADLNSRLDKCIQILYKVLTTVSQVSPNIYVRHRYNSPLF